MSIYPKDEYETGNASAVTQPDRLRDKLGPVRPNLPGSIIVIHGVNDVGVAFGEVEKGLCAGLGTRLGCEGRFKPADYRIPGAEDRNRLEDDPDAVFFKRHLREGDFTPVIPFYWGFREDKDAAKSGDDKGNIRHGQNTDRFGNRLDKDFSKGGGPFANATNTLVDMWNRGFDAGPFDVVDRLMHDSQRPVLGAPGRMYMVLAAKRLAALISMIRDYDPDEVVSIVAHSQGCLLSLLAQAFLMQDGLRPADTLVLTHPPYSLEEDKPVVEALSELLVGGKDEAMERNYERVKGRQTLNARLQTLVNIVRGVVEKKHEAPALTALTDHGEHRGMVGAKWEPGDDRDNRGKVYLYFCPEDMTVALYGMQGIGWQGVPDYVSGQRVVQGGAGQRDESKELYARAALDELTALNGKDKGFFQRVFTAKLRKQPGGSTPHPVLVGAEPHDFALRVKGESAHGHASPELDTRRASAPEVDPDAVEPYRAAKPKPGSSRRDGIRRITGEPLKPPVMADLYSGAIDPLGRRQTVDPIEAAIATTSRYGLTMLIEESMDDPRPATQPTKRKAGGELTTQERDAVTQTMNEGRQPGDIYTLERASYASDGKLQIVRHETANELRLRLQQTGESARSFHSAIFGSMANHQQVTAYDVAIGGGKAVSDPTFYKYLCAVADWRMKKPGRQEAMRLGILEWKKFQDQFGKFYGVEPEWRKKLIEGSCDYYSTGLFTVALPILPTDLPPLVVSETNLGNRIEPARRAASLDSVFAGQRKKPDPSLSVGDAGSAT